MTRDDVINRAAEESKDHRGHVLLWLCGVLLFIGLVALGVAAFVGFAKNDTLAEQNASLSRRADENAAAVSQLAEQVRHLGGTPVVEPGQPGSPGATGATGAVGPQGPKGDKGDPGISPPCLAEPDRCRGPVGDPGLTGAQGATGSKGDPGPVGPAGPAGPTGPAGPAGPQGEQGPDGPDGPTGPQGPPGPTCPDGYTAQARQQALETWWVCVATTTK